MHKECCIQKNCVFNMILLFLIMDIIEDKLSLCYVNIELNGCYALVNVRSNPQLVKSKDSQLTVKSTYEL